MMNNVTHSPDVTKLLLVIAKEGIERCEDIRVIANHGQKFDVRVLADWQDTPLGNGPFVGLKDAEQVFWMVPLVDQLGAIWQDCGV